MKQVVRSSRKGEVSVRESARPEPKPREVLVRNAVSLLSAGTERAALDFDEKSLLAKARSRPDLVRKVLDRARREGPVEAFKAAMSKLEELRPLGYSCAGFIEASGSDIEAGSFAVGSRVACSGANYANHAEFVTVPASLVSRIPENVSLEAASYVTVASIALHGVRLAMPTLGERAAVIGCGLIGQIAVQLLVAHGVRVLAIDPIAEKVDLALASGASAGVVSGRDDLTAAAASLTDGFGVDFALVCAATSSSDPIVTAAEICRDRARVVAVGATGLDLPRRPFYDKELSFYISRSYGPGRYDPMYEEAGVDYPIGYVRWTEGRNFDAVLELMSRGALDVTRLTTHRFPIERATEAYELIRSGREPFLGVVLEYRGSEDSRDSGSGPQAHGTSPEPRATSAVIRNDATVAVLGAGAFARSVLLPSFKLAGAQFEMIASAAGLSATDLAQRFEFRNVGSEADVLESAAATVIIATRHDSHAALARQALERGKHVFLEKPLAITREQLDELRAALRGEGPILTAGFNRRFAPASVALKAFFDGAGEPLVMTARINAGMVPRSHWIQDDAIGGGRIIGECCHFIDWMTFVSGALPVEVHAFAVDASRADFPNRDQLVMSIRFAGGSVGSLVYVARGDTRLSKERYEVFAAQRSAVLDDFQQLTTYRDGREQVAWKGSQAKGHRQEAAAFLAAVKGQGAPPIPYEQLFAVTEATFAAEESLRSGLPVRV